MSAIRKSKSKAKRSYVSLAICYLLVLLLTHPSISPSISPSVSSAQSLEIDDISRFFMLSHLCMCEVDCYLQESETHGS